MVAIAVTISAHSTERTIVETAKRILADLGLSNTWYYDCPAFVLLGIAVVCLSLGATISLPRNPLGWRTS